MNKAILAAVIYLLAAILTFGHSASRSTLGDTPMVSAVERRAATGVMAGLFWPLYWSWEMFEKDVESP